jgi:hypothetical protein
METPMTQLDLSKGEAAALKEVLESALSDLRYEINDTDSHDYREKLRVKQHAIEKALEQLG